MLQVLLNYFLNSLFYSINISYRLSNNHTILHDERNVIIGEEAGDGTVTFVVRSKYAKK